MGSFVRRCTAFAALGALLAPILDGCADREIHSIVMALDGTGDRPRDTFFTDTSIIYCVGKYASSRKDITINAVIRRVNDENNVKIDEIYGVGELAPGISAGVVAFEMNRPTPPPDQPGGTTLPYPVGTYQCELYVDGLDPAAAENQPGSSARNHDPQQEVQFKIQYPVCPVAYPQTGDACGGYFKTNQVCRGADARTKCTCDGTVWQCM